MVVFLIFCKKSSQINEQHAPSTKDTHYGRLKILCIIFTCPKKIAENRLLTVLNIWARKCDNYRFVTLIPNGTNLTRTRNDSVEIEEPFHIMQPQGLVKEKYQELSHKVFLTFRQIYQDFDEHDWYLKST